METLIFRNSREFIKVDHNSSGTVGAQTDRKNANNLGANIPSNLTVV